MEFKAYFSVFINPALINLLIPLVELYWITMTIPDKPTSPNQKYISTLKGRLVLEILKRNEK